MDLAGKEENAGGSSEPSGQLSSPQHLAHLVDSTFPSNQLVHAFGYGSGVFSQSLASNQQSAGMLDLILVLGDVLDATVTCSF